MTANKRRKNKTRAIMDATGTNYVRAARAAGSKTIKDPVSLSWSPGTIQINGSTTKVYDEFIDQDYSHLLISGMMSAEPERLLEDLTDQLLSRNTTDDVQLSVIEPAMSLKKYEHNQQVDYYLDSWSTGTIMKDAADFVEGVVAEMARRYALMMNHPKAPKNMRAARKIAIAESSETGSSPTQHPLYMPYKVIVINRLESLLALVFLEGSDDERRFTLALSELVSKARAAGIFLACSSMAGQYNIPSNIRNHMRIIGTSMQSQEISEAFLGDESCFGLPSKKGVIKYSPSRDGSVAVKVMFDRNQNALPYNLGPVGQGGGQG